MHGRTSRNTILIAMVCGCAGDALAQDGNAPQPAPAEQSSGQPPTGPGLTRTISPVGRPGQDGAPSAQLRLFGLHVLRSDLDQGGDVSLTRVGASVGVDVPATDTGTIGMEFGARADWFDFGDGALPFVQLPPTSGQDPWEEIYTYNAGVSWQDRIDDQWGYRVGAFVQSSGESGADFSDTLEYGGFVGFSYAPSRDLVIGAGLGITSQLEDDARFLPIPFVRWQITDKWLLSSDRTANLGGIALTYQATDTLRAGAFVGFDSNTFRLSDEGSVPNGVGRFSMIPVGALLTWDATEQVSVSGSVGVALAQEYELNQSNGDDLVEDDAEASAVFGLSVTMRF